MFLDLQFYNHTLLFIFLLLVSLKGVNRYSSPGSSDLLPFPPILFRSKLSSYVPLVGGAWHNMSLDVKVLIFPSNDTNFYIFVGVIYSDYFVYCIVGYFVVLLPHHGTYHFLFFQGNRLDSGWFGLGGL